MRKKIIRLMPALITIIVAGVVFCCLQEKKPEAKITEETTAPAAEQRETYVQEIWVYVCGEVERPGVYCLPIGSRIFEAVQMAGGMTDAAAPDLLNLAAEVTDGQQIYVPGEEERLSADGGVFQERDERININTASEQELITLPGIGTAKARAIIAYREETPFRTIEEIMNVSGIKESSFNRIRDLIKV